MTNELVKGLEQQIQRLQDELSETKSESAALRTRMFENQRRAAEIEQSQDLKIRELSAAVTQLKEYNTQLIRLNKETKEEYEKIPSESEFQALYMKLLLVHAESERKRKEGEERIVKLTQYYDKEIAKLTEKMDARKDQESEALMKETIAKLRTANDSIAARASELSAKVERMREKKRNTAKLMEELSLLREENQTIKMQLSHSKIPADASELESLRSAVEQSDLRESALQLELENSEKRRHELESTNKTLQNEIQKLQASAPDKSSLYTEINNLKRSNASKDDTLAGLTSQLRIIREENARLKKRLQNSLAEKSNDRNLLMKCEQLQFENEQHVNTIASLTESISEMKAQLASYEHANMRMASELEIMKTEKEEVKSEPIENAQIDALRSDLDEAKFVIKELLSASEDAQDCMKLRDVVKTLQEKLTDSEMVHTNSLRERDELRKINARLMRENKDLKASIGKKRTTFVDQNKIAVMQQELDTLNKRVEGHEAFKAKMQEKQKQLRAENDQLKTQLAKAKSDNDNYRFQLMDLREQII